MKKKYILRAVVALVVILVIAVVALAFSLGAIVKKGVETIGPSATKVEVKLAAARVWLLTGRVQLDGFVLGNPPGCKTPSAISVDDVKVRIEPGSVFSGKVVVNSIEVKAPVVTLEGGLSDNNLTTIEKNLNNYNANAPDKSKSPASSSGPAKPARTLQVNDLVVTGAKLQVKMTYLAGQTITLPLPDIHLTDLGTGPKGITAAEVGQRALNAVLSAATTEVAKNTTVLGKNALDGAKGATKQAADLIKGLIH